MSCKRDQVTTPADAIVAACGIWSGAVEVRRRGSDAWEPIGPSPTLRLGDELRTGAASTARVDFLAGGALELEQGTRVVIDMVSVGEDAGLPLVALSSGAVRGSLEKRHDGMVLASQDGSRARLRAGGEHKTMYRLTYLTAGVEIAVSEGAMVVAGESQQLALAAGQRSDFAANQLDLPTELIAFPRSVQPGIDARIHYEPGLRIDLTWKAVPGASQYRVQVARDLSFTHLVSSADLITTTYSFAVPSEGMYAWRVSSRDMDGRDGEYGFARRVFFQKDAPVEHLMFPQDGYTVSFIGRPAPIMFAWKPVQDATAYRLAVARSDDPLRDPVVDEVVQASSASVPKLAEGIYSWGVYLDTAPPTPIFIRPRRLTVSKSRNPTVNTRLESWGQQ